MEGRFIPFFLSLYLICWILTLLIINHNALIQIISNHLLIRCILLSDNSSINLLYELFDLLDIPIMFSLDLFVQSG